MPITRRAQISSTSEHSGSTTNRRVNTKGTRSSKATHNLDDETHTLRDRAAKRRRTETSQLDGAAADLSHEPLDPSAAPEASEQPTSNDANASLRELRAQLKVHSEHDGQQLESETAPAETFGQLDPDMTKAISDIIDHSERFEQYCAMGAADDEDLPGSKGLVFAKTGSRMKAESLPILDNLSSQILSTLAKSSYQDTIALMREPDSEAGQEYSTVRSLFDHTKRVYSSKSPFLSPSELDLLGPAQVEILRKANLATFVSSIFGSHEIGFAELNDHFLDIFVPENGRLLKAQGSLFLDLKTQAFISSMHTPERSKTELLYTLFPDDIEQRILVRRPGARGLAPSEQDFVKRALSRRDILLGDVNNPAALDALPHKYHWDDFLRDISSYISKSFESLNTQPKNKFLKGRSTNGEGREPALEQLQSNFSVIPPPLSEAPGEPPKQEDFVAKAARAAQIALQGHNISIPAPGPAQMQPYPPPKQSYQQPVIHTNFQQYTPPTQSTHPGSSRSNLPPNYGPLPNLPHISQTAPTQVLYERARQAATTKASPTSRRAGLPSQRRPWTTEEENALMAGLDRVRGPHWSQILAMFGPGGTINESLKDRNQVQLKDKARNLKLFFLKSGIEVPYYLKYVTGDLKTRAPGQASKNEARERERQQGEEDKAHFNGVQGIMALAGATQSPQQQNQQQGVGEAISQGDGGGGGGVNELQGFGTEAPPHQNGLQSLDGSVDVNLDPNLEGLPDLPPAVNIETDGSEPEGEMREKMEA